MKQMDNGNARSSQEQLLLFFQKMEVPPPFRLADDQAVLGSHIRRRRFHGREDFAAIRIPADVLRLRGSESGARWKADSPRLAALLRKGGNLLGDRNDVFFRPPSQIVQNLIPLIIFGELC